MTLAQTIDGLRRKTLRVVKPQRHSFSRIRQAVRLFRNGYAPKAVRRHNARAWLAAVDRLGDRWLYAQPQALVRRTKP